MKFSDPLVSILIPCYNHAKYIEDTLNSIIKDSYQNKEICIIDDGSSDDSVRVISHWIRNNNNLINVNFRTRENKGVCATLNELIGLAQGDYILLCASDDILYGDTIKTRIEILLNNPDKKVVVSDAYVIDENNNIIMPSSMEDYNKGNKNLFKTDEGIIYSVLMSPCISGATSIIKKNIFDIIGLYPENLKAEDWWFFQRAASENYIYFYDIKVACYRIHSSNISGQNSVYRVDLINTIIKTYILNIKYFRLKYKAIIVMQIFRYIRLGIKIKFKK
jgi:glycosyltransferase involved in cell wall biosynthesis